MPIDAGTIYSEIRIELSKLRGDIKKVNANFDKMSKDVGKSTNNLQGVMKKAFTEITGYLSLRAITQFVKGSVQQFAGFEQAIGNVVAVAGNAPGNFEKLELAAKEAGETTRFTATQAADALYFLSSAGLDATQSAQALDSVLTLAGATQSDLAFTAQTLTSILSQYNLEATEGARVSNVFAAAAANSQATMEKLSAAFLQVGPVASGLGISLEQTTGALQILFNAGFKGESAGRALKSALADLANESSATNQKLQELGVSFDEVNPAAVGLEGAIEALEKRNLTTAQVLDVFGKIAGPQLATLLSKGSDALEEYTEAVTGTNAAAEQYAIQNDTLQGSLDRLGSVAESTAIGFGKSLAPAVRFVTDAIAGFLSFLNKMPGLLQIITAGLGVFAIALGAATGGITLLLSGAALLIAGFTGLLGVGKSLNETTAALAKSTDEYKQITDELKQSQDKLNETEKTNLENRKELLRLDVIKNLRNVQKAYEKLNKETEKNSDNLVFAKALQDNYKRSIEQLEQKIQDIAQSENANDTRNIKRKKELEAQLENVRKKYREAQNEVGEFGSEIAQANEDVKAGIDEISNAIVVGAITQNDIIGFTDELQQKILNRVADIKEEQKKLNQEKEEGAETSEEELDTQRQITAEKERQARLDAFLQTRADTIGSIKKDLDATKKVGDVLGLDDLDIINDQISKTEAAIRSFIEAYPEVLDNPNANPESIKQLEEAREKLEELREEQERLTEAQEDSAKAAKAQEEAFLRIGDVGSQIYNGLANTVNAFYDMQLSNYDQDSEEFKRIKKEQFEFNKAYNITNALISGARGAVAAYASLAEIPVVGPALGIAAAAALSGFAIAQAGFIANQQAPSFATGGIVLPSNGGTMARVAENNNPELLLNGGSTGEAVMQQFADKIGGSIGMPGGNQEITIQVPVSLDGRILAQSIVRYINNRTTGTLIKKGSVIQ